MKNLKKMVATDMEWEKINFTCPECGSETKPTKITKDGFVIRAWKCVKCNFAITHPEDVERLLMSKQGVKGTVSTVGTQTVLRVPASVRECYHLDRTKGILFKPINSKQLMVEVCD